MPEPSDVIELRNSPGVPITITRGGTDPISGDQRPEQWVSLSWDETYSESVVDPETGETTTVERTRTVERGFLGP